MRVTIRDPKSPRQFKFIHEVSDHQPSLVYSTEKIILGPFERTLVRAQIITQNPNEYLYRNVMIQPSGVHTRPSFVSENTLTSVREDGIVFLPVRNRTANENLILHSKTVLGKAQPTTFMFRPFMVDQIGKTPVSFVEHANNFGVVDLSDTSTEFGSFAQTFLSSTETSEEGLSENEKCERTDPQLLKSVPSPDL